MNRFILTGTNRDFPRAAEGAGTSYSGAVPGSTGGGLRPSSLHTPVKKGAGPTTPARRPLSTLAQAVQVVALWDTGEFDTVDISKAVRISEAEVERIVHFIREERRARA